MAFTTYELVVMRGECIARLPMNRKFRDESPGAVRGLATEHVAALESAIEKLNVELTSRGVRREEADETAD